MVPGLSSSAGRRPINPGGTDRPRPRPSWSAPFLASPSAFLAAPRPSCPYRKRPASGRGPSPPAWQTDWHSRGGLGPFSGLGAFGGLGLLRRRFFALGLVALFLHFTRRCRPLLAAGAGRGKGIVRHLGLGRRGHLGRPASPTADRPATPTCGARRGSSLHTAACGVSPPVPSRPCGRPPDTAPGPAAPGLAPAPATSPRCRSCSGRPSRTSPLAGNRLRPLADAPGSDRSGRGSNSGAGSRKPASMALVRNP